MKIIRTVVSLLLAAVLLANTAVFADGVVSSWAQDEVEEAAELEIIPGYLEKDYTQSITRVEFAKVGLFYLALQYNLSINDLWSYYMLDPRLCREDNSMIHIFSDTDDTDADIAFLAGIVKGRGDGIFDPDSTMTREEAAKMLYNTYLVYAENVEEADNSAVLDRFADRDEISLWAEDAVAFVAKYGIMGGISEDEFAPKACYTREQCFVTFLRMYKNAPCSRLYGTAKNLCTFEEMVEEILSQYSYEVVYSCETETCAAYYGMFRAAKPGNRSFEIVYKDGGKRSIHDQFTHTEKLYLTDFSLSGDGTVLYCRQADCVEHYKIDLEKATVEEITAAEYEGAVFMAE